MSIELPYGYVLYHYAELNSTNSEAMRLAESGIADGTVIVADKQISGRGQFNREWNSPLGNLYCSIVVRRFTNNNTSELSFVTAVAVGETLNGIFGKSNNIQYKWPNDILVNEKKISGILLESKMKSDQIQDWVVIGVGVNIITAPTYAISIRDVNNNNNVLSNLQLLERFIINFNKLRKNWNNNGFTQIRGMWLQRAYNINKYVSVKDNKSFYYGIFMGIDINGNLVLKKDDGSLITFNSASIFF